MDAVHRLVMVASWGDMNEALRLWDHTHDGNVEARVGFISDMVSKLEGLYMMSEPTEEPLLRHRLYSASRGDGPVSGPPDARVCIKCHMAFREPIHRCPCGVYYCTKECQRAHWPDHKADHKLAMERK